MKLLICNTCGDVFNLNFTLKSCSCGETKGKYITNQDAVVNGKGASMAIGNGSLVGALMRLTPDSTMNREDYQSHGNVLCWVRPHEGPGNPHTKVDADLGKEPS